MEYQKLMLDAIVFALWFFLPAGVANMTPLFVSHVPLLKKWNTPLDFGKKWRDKPIFGPNKTWRGLVAGTLAGGLTGLVVYFFNPSLVDRLGIAQVSPAAEFFILGAVLGFGALAGDAIESFFKRQAGIASGKSWFPFDQADYIIGGLMASAPLVPLSFWQTVYVFIIWFLLHPVATFIGWLLKLKDSPI